MNVLRLEHSRYIYLMILNCGKLCGKTCGKRSDSKVRRCVIYSLYIVYLDFSSNSHERMEMLLECYVYTIPYLFWLVRNPSIIV